MAASAEQWSNWTMDQIRGAIEDERERTVALLTELLVDIQKDVIPEVIATLPALRGPAGPVGPPGKLPIAKEWTRETVFYEGYVVTYDGGSYQALRDTGEPPDNETYWRFVSQLLVATPRQSGTVARSRKTRSTQPMTRSRSTAGRSWHFVTIRAHVLVPDGSCLLRQANAALPAKPGPRGPAGIAGPTGVDAAAVVGWDIDRATYTVVPIMSDGSSGPPLNLRGLFEQFLDEAG